MSYINFDEDIQISPFLSFDQILTSLIYASRSNMLSTTSFSCALIPQDSLLYPSSILWSFYWSLLRYPAVSRIVYIRQDDNIIVPTRPADEGVDHIFGKRISYDIPYYDHFDIWSLENKNDFYVDSIFRYSHVFYARLLHDIVLVPLVIPSSLLGDKKLFSWLTSYIKSLRNDPTTVCVLIDSSNNPPLAWSTKDDNTIRDIFFQFYKGDNLIDDSVLLKSKKRHQIDILMNKYQWFLYF